MNEARIPLVPSRCLAIGIALLALYGPGVAWADCVDGVRKPTPAELEFHSRAIAALVAALPPAPPGVKMSGTPADFSRLPAIGVLCREQKEGDFTLEASRFYVLEYSADEFRRRRAERTALSEQLHALTVLPPDLKAQRDALEQQAAAGYTATDAARKAGDQAGAKAREAQAHGFSRQARELQKRHDEAVKPQADAIRQRQEGIDLDGQKAAVRLAMNAQRLPDPALAIPFGAYGSASRSRSAGLKVYNVVWSVGGTDTPLRQALAAAIDRDRLQALVGRPLPATAQSEAAAARAAPAPVAGLPSPQPAPAGAPAAPAAAPLAAPAPGPAGTAATGGNSPPDGARKAVDAVNQLRGLFGR